MGAPMTAAVDDYNPYAQQPQQFMQQGMAPGQDYGGPMQPQHGAVYARQLRPPVPQHPMQQPKVYPSMLPHTARKPHVSHPR